MANWLRNWALIFLWSLVCLYERISGQEVSCPKCWKCTTARWIMFSGLVVGSVMIYRGVT